MVVVGPPGMGKEALGYWFTRSGLIQGDYCLYATHRPVSDVLRDMKGLGVGVDRVPGWISSSGSQVRLDRGDGAAALGVSGKRTPDGTLKRHILLLGAARGR